MVSTLVMQHAERPVAANGAGVGTGADAGARALIGTGEVRHARLRPVQHAFSYPSFFLLLPMRSLRRAPLPDLPRNRFGLISFHDSDHGDGGPDSLAWLESLLQSEGLQEADGEIWLHCLPRVLGHAFKPVSFWYCHRADLSLAAVVVEVNNTFGERHCYLLRGPALAWGREVQATKVFHVSPFCAVEGRYRFRFFRNDPGARPAPCGRAGDDATGTPASVADPAAGAARSPRTVARIEHDDASGPLLVTSVSGDLAPLTRAALRHAFCRMPLLTLGVVARIHWQALLLWLRRVPFFSKPAPPAASLSRGGELAAEPLGRAVAARPPSVPAASAGPATSPTTAPVTSAAP